MELGFTVKITSENDTILCLWYFNSQNPSVLFSKDLSASKFKKIKLVSVTLLNSSCVHWFSFIKSFLFKTEDTQPSQIIPKLKVRI